MTNKKGFTLIELLVVIVIIGILATAGFAAFNTAQANARDGMRRSDISQIKGLFQSVNVNIADWDAVPEFDSDADGAADGTGITAWLTSEYPDGLPGDPDGTTAYHVCVDADTLNATITAQSERDTAGFMFEKIGTGSDATGNACEAEYAIDVTL